MLRVVRFMLVLMLVFGLVTLMQAFGLDQGTAIMIISVGLVGLALGVERTLRNRASRDNPNP
ncbi:MAG: hypothetical protein M1572_08985 [Gammaproteobacteria bacterium]|nr:hypothetical protein [Gammaproteobacteria bacterium]UCG18854.1 MAG: hypothetical protein JSU84_01120 [Thiotrichales bacterium]HQT02315.1 hypothetical protein [Thiotrichales bacterium]